jgi:DNA modification methylase
MGSTNEGDLVLDPFMGTGTTGLVSKELNRNYIGFELQKEYIDL